MRYLGILVCRNGLGHIRRIIQVVDFLLLKEKKINIEIFFDFKQKEMLKNWKIINKLEKNESVKFFNFSPYPFWSSNLKDLNPKKLLNWHKDLKKLNLEKFDLIISDNLIETIIYNKNTILSGSFLWHIIYKIAFCDNKEIENYYNFCSEILYKNKTKMIVNKYFFMPQLEEQVETLKVGMLKSLKRNRKKLKDGKIGVLFAYFNELKLNNFRSSNNNFDFFADLRTFQKFRKENFKKFSYEKMGFSKIEAILGTSSMGTITESFGTSTPLFVLPSKNPEILHNLNILKKLGLGFETKDVKDGLEKIKDFYKGELNYKNYLNSLKKIEKNGLNETYKLLKNFL